MTDERLERARHHLGRCLLCEHRCGADRRAGERGPCKADAVARVFKHRVEFGEEQELIPSHLFYLSGCDLRCAFCIAEVNAFDPRRGRALTPEFFTEAVAPPKAVRPQIKSWDVVALRRFMDVAQDDGYSPLWLLAAHTGMRQGALLGLRWRDVDLERGVARVIQALHVA